MRVTAIDRPVMSRRPRRWACPIVLALVLASVLPETARAQVPTGSTPDAGTAGAGGDELGSAKVDGGMPVVTSPDGGAAKRPRPDYEGRDPESHATEDTLLFVPRVVLLPVYLVAEYAVAVPVGALATTAEQNQWPKAIHDALTFGPNQEGGIFPTFLIDFGLRPSIGFHLFLPAHNRRRSTGTRRSHRSRSTRSSPTRRRPTMASTGSRSASWPRASPSETGAGPA